MKKTINLILRVVFVDSGIRNYIVDNIDYQAYDIMSFNFAISPDSLKERFLRNRE